MIDEIEQLITARCSRTKLKFLRDSLKETLCEATVHHEELLLLLEDTDSEFNEHWIEELSLRVNTCFSEISGYLAAKQQIESWVQDTISQMRNKPENVFPLDQECSSHLPEVLTISKERIPKITDTLENQSELYSEFVGTLSQPEPTDAFYYFGPITVKVLRSQIKRWECIFTCLATRAVHLEVASSLESNDFINILERFICRRGNPKLIRSDCGTNFKEATNELKGDWEKGD